MKAIGKILSAVLGGFFGGALVGLLEAVVIASAGGEEFGVFRFGATSYGIIGALLGGGVGLATVVLAPLARDAALAAGLSAGTVAALLGLAVTRFRIVRDVFAENLPIASGQGIAVHAGLLVGALAVLLLVRSLVLATARRTGSALAAGLVLAVVATGLGSATTAAMNRMAGPAAADRAPATAQGPSVVLIIADTLRADYLGAYGSRTTKTPAIDRLAADGVVFENAFANSSWTRPSVATIVTSLYASSHKVMHKTDLLPDGVTTIAEALADGGYRTAGYVTNINVAPSFRFEQGFHEYHYLTPEFFFGATDSGSKLAFYSGMRLLRERFLAKEKWVEHYYQDARTVNGAALPWLDRNGDGAFFALIHYMDPHDPYFEIPYNGVAVARVDTPNPDPSQRDRLSRLYSDNIEYLDGFVANLVESLKAAGRYDDTVIALVSDHGEEFHEHAGWWHGTTLYDEQLRVPLVVKLAKNAKAGTRVKQPAQLLDVAPTLAAAAGVDAPEAWQGRDLFSGAAAPSAVFAEEDHEGNRLHAIRSGKWKLIVANEGNPRGLAPVELYDVDADPGETRNLAADSPDVVARLREDLEALKVLAASRAVSGTSGEIDSATSEKLRALGYAN